MKSSTIPEPRHKHKFVIPIEWETEPNGLGAVTEFTKTTVTKLRCECGETIEI